MINGSKIKWCCTGTGECFHQQWQWLFLADASVCEPSQDPEQLWLLAVKYTVDGETNSTASLCHCMHNLAVTFNIGQQCCYNGAFGCNNGATSVRSPAMNYHLNLADS